MIGQVMDESVNVAYSYIKSNLKQFKIKDFDFEHNDIHIHFLDGAIKKDGPSAGIAITTSLISVLTGKKVPRTVAMTGEISLRGDVLKIGGLKEKVIGAYNQGVKTDLEEIPIEVKEEIEFILVKNYKEIFNTLFK